MPPEPRGPWLHHNLARSMPGKSEIQSSRSTSPSSLKRPWHRPGKKWLRMAGSYFWSENQNGVSGFCWFWVESIISGVYSQFFLAMLMGDMIFESFLYPEKMRLFFSIFRGGSLLRTYGQILIRREGQREAVSRVVPLVISWVIFPLI